MSEPQKKAVYPLNIKSDIGGNIKILSHDCNYVSYGENVALEATPKNGYLFNGWYLNDVKVSDEKEYSFTYIEDTSLKAKFIEMENPADGVCAANVAKGLGFNIDSDNYANENIQIFNVIGELSDKSFDVYSNMNILTMNIKISGNMDNINSAELTIFNNQEEYKTIDLSNLHINAVGDEKFLIVQLCDNNIDINEKYDATITFCN